MTTIITREDVLNILPQVVAEKGEDYVYPGANTLACYYADPETGAPSCIVGHLFAKLNVDDFHELIPSGLNDMTTVQDLDYVGDRVIPENNYDEVGDYAPRFSEEERESPFLFEDEAVARALIAAQQAQDTGATWGKALEVAREALKRGGLK